MIPIVLKEITKIVNYTDMQSLPLTSGVYMIKNVNNGRVYIGFAKSIRARIGQHISALKGGYHRSKLMQADWDLDRNCLACRVLQNTNDFSREADFILHYNSHIGGYNGLIGREVPPSIAEKISESNKGREFSDEHRKHLSESRLGIEFSAGHRQHLKDAWNRRKSEK